MTLYRFIQAAISFASVRGSLLATILRRGLHLEKVSVAAAVWLTPLRDRLGLAYQTLVDGYFTNVEVAEFARAAVQGLAGPVIMLWDGGPMHKGGPIRETVEQSLGRLDIEPMPAHAPELMPVEFLVAG